MDSICSSGIRTTVSVVGGALLLPLSCAESTNMASCLLLHKTTFRNRFQTYLLNLVWTLDSEYETEACLQVRSVSTEA